METDPHTIINRITAIWVDGQTSTQKAFTLLNKLNLFSSTEAEVSKTYKLMAMRIHPDKCDHPNAKVAFQKLGEAKKVALEHIENPLPRSNSTLPRSNSST